MRFFCLFALLGVLLSGCASNVTLSGRYLSNLDASAEIDKSANIQVVSDPKGNLLTNKRFIPDVISAFKKRGFSHISEHEARPDYTLTVDFQSREEADLQSIPVFSQDFASPYSVCHLDQASNTRTCSTHYYFPPPTISGYRTVSTPTTVFTFHFTLSDPSKHPLLESTSTVVHANCSQWKVFQFLAEDAISRTSFQEPIDKTYSVTMPKGYSCQ